MDDLERFANWFTSNSSVIAAVPFNDAVHYVEGVACVLMYRSAPYQVQMFVVPPNHIIPEHVHPNVDSIELYMGGQIRFSHSGKFVISEDSFTSPADNGLPVEAGRMIRVRPDDVHGGIFGPAGGVFLSIQKWLNGVEPHCVSADYSGQVMGPDHLGKVVNGEAFVGDVNAHSAASKE